MKKIRKEIELMGSIQECGNVIRLHGVYEDDAQVYVVMELCSGGDLERVLEVCQHFVKTLCFLRLVVQELYTENSSLLISICMKCSYDVCVSVSVLLVLLSQGCFVPC